MRGFFSGDRERKKLGVDGEQIATAYLKRKGYRIVDQNVRFKQGEIDIVAIDQKTIVFVEVKTRRNMLKGAPWEAVDRRKEQKLTEAALIYLKKRNLLDHPARFDIVSILWKDENSQPEIRHFANAFESTDRYQIFD